MIVNLSSLIVLSEIDQTAISLRRLLPDSQASHFCLKSDRLLAQNTQPFFHLFFVFLDSEAFFTLFFGVLLNAIAGQVYDHMLGIVLNYFFLVYVFSTWEPSVKHKTLSTFL